MSKDIRVDVFGDVIYFRRGMYMEIEDKRSKRMYFDGIYKIEKIENATLILK